MRRNLVKSAFAGMTLAAIGGAIYWSTSATPIALAQPSYTALDEETAARIDALRAAAGIDNDALAALDLSQVQLETVLSGLRTWYETNAATLAQQNESVARARATVRGLATQLGQGEDVAAALTAAESELAAQSAQLGGKTRFH